MKRLGLATLTLGTLLAIFGGASTASARDNDRRRDRWDDRHDRWHDRNDRHDRRDRERDWRRQQRERERWYNYQRRNSNRYYNRGYGNNDPWRYNNSRGYYDQFGRWHNY